LRSLSPISIPRHLLMDRFLQIEEHLTHPQPK